MCVKDVNAITAEAYIFTVWRQGSLFMIMIMISVKHYQVCYNGNSEPTKLPNAKFPKQYISPACLSTPTMVGLLRISKNRT